MLAETVNAQRHHERRTEHSGARRPALGGSIDASRPGMPAGIRTPGSGAREVAMRDAGGNARGGASATPRSGSGSEP